MNGEQQSWVVIWMVVCATIILCVALICVTQYHLNEINSRPHRCVTAAPNTFTGNVHDTVCTDKGF